MLRALGEDDLRMLRERIVAGCCDLPELHQSHAPVTPTFSMSDGQNSPPKLDYTPGGMSLRAQQGIEEMAKGKDEEDERSCQGEEAKKPAGEV
jgi:hypothetical protein